MPRPASFVVTPYHSPIGLSVSQFVLSDQFAPTLHEQSPVVSVAAPGDLGRLRQMSLAPVHPV